MACASWLMNLGFAGGTSSDQPSVDTVIRRADVSSGTIRRSVGASSNIRRADSSSSVIRRP